MTAKVIFIDDQEVVRETYLKRLRRMFNGYAEIITLAPSPTIEEMMKELDQIDDKLMYVIDEDLTLTGEALYYGSTLIEKIRMTDRRIPIYILTSDANRVEKYQGNIEFLIDKADWNENQNNLMERFLRHINTYNEIKNEQEKRFDVLLCKSLIEPLSHDEISEYNILNSNRGKQLSDESVISEEDLELLEEKSRKLISINEELRRLQND